MSPWAGPIVLVQKPDGSIRFCVDYRKLNDATHKDSYPLPRIDGTLDRLGGAQYFSTLDRQLGYWQVPVEGKDQQKTAFITPQGLFEFRRMPFGLCNAPATFQQMMHVSRPWLRVTGPRNHYERRLNIDVWPHDKPNTTQGPTNIAGLVQVQPHTINRQRLLVLRCE